MHGRQAVRGLQLDDGAAWGRGGRPAGTGAGQGTGSRRQRPAARPPVLHLITQPQCKLCPLLHMVCARLTSRAPRLAALPACTDAEAPRGALPDAGTRTCGKGEGCKGARQQVRSGESGQRQVVCKLRARPACHAHASSSPGAALRHLSAAPAHHVLVQAPAQQAAGVHPVEAKGQEDKACGGGGTGGVRKAAAAGR